jgi:hypothetical protein
MTRPPSDPATRLERDARALAAALAAPVRPDEAPAVLRTASALAAAVARAHPVVAGQSAALGPEHAELAESAAVVLGAVTAWAATPEADAARPARRRAAAAAARTLHDDLRVHHAHEREHQVGAQVGEQVGTE